MNLPRMSLHMPGLAQTHARAGAALAWQERRGAAKLAGIPDAI
jgi:hypothetical protein